MKHAQVDLSKVGVKVAIGDHVFETVAEPITEIIKTGLVTTEELVIGYRYLLCLQETLKGMN